MALLVRGAEDFDDSTDDVVRAAAEDTTAAGRKPTSELDIAVVAVVDNVAADVLLLVSCTLLNGAETVTDAASFTANLPRLSASLLAVNDTDCAGTEDDCTAVLE